MSNNRTGLDFEAWQRKKQREAQKRRVEKRNKENLKKHNASQDQLKKALKGPASAGLSLGHYLGKNLMKKARAKKKK